MVINKVELKQSKNYKDIGYELGFGNPVSISAKNKSAKLIINNVIIKFLNLKINNQNIISNEKKIKDINKISISILGNLIQENQLYLIIFMEVIE